MSGGWFGRIAALFMLAAVSGGAAPGFAAPAAGDEWAKAAGGAEVREGLLRAFVDRKANRIHLRLPPPDAEGVSGRFIYQASLTTGLGSTPIGLDRAESGRALVVAFRRAGRRVILQAENPTFRAGNGDADEARAVRHSFAVSNLWAGDIAAEGPDGAMLIDITSFLTQDTLDIAARLKARRQGTFRASAPLSYADAGRVGVFPENLEFEAVQTFVSDEPGAEVRAVTPDPRAVTLTVHHSFVKLPGPGFQPRRHDPRTGTSVQVLVNDYATALDAPSVYRLVRRFRLEKVDPSAARSRVKKPIVFYVDRAAPEPIRSALVEGAGWWNQAFEAAGFIDAFRVEVLPEGADPMDARYNVINWVHRQTRGWSTGQTIVDPRTGEIVRGVVQLGSLRIRQDRLIFEGLVGADKSGKGGPDDPVEIALSRIRQLGMHETGHALGFSHNFAGSTFGGRASTLDYPAPLIHVRNGKLDFSDAYVRGAGAWDRFSVRWLYSQVPPGADEARYLDGIAREATAQGMRFIADDEHPASTQWDNGSDPVAGLADVLAVRKIALDRFGLNNIPKGAAVADLRRVFAPIYLFHRYQVDAVVKQVGGVDYAYAVNGDGREQAEPIPAADQRRALKALGETLSPARLDVSDALVGLLSQAQSGTPDRQFEIEVFETLGGPVFDPVAVAVVASDLTLRQLVEAPRLNRVLEQHRRDPGQVSVGELLSWLFGAVQGQAGEPPRAAEIRRRQQARLVGNLVDTLGDKALSPTVAGLIDQHLKAFGASLDTATGAPEAVAFNRRLARLIGDEDRDALARLASDMAPAPRTPPGSPIGEACWFCAADLPPPGA
ncbi:MULTISPECIES: zinc-dependent metalloprotease [unclassified Phenylobacterium]|uniref:zinc-dependent metalloprotease n=1 Tax=unclassified Phenylobacterium TaxID=2640670 RepID=UPI00083B39F2|nr:MULTISPECIES: zinc-dependent metalloprotease [unclassified Phenylobacterium]